jgi:hypothetical protein
VIGGVETHLLSRGASPALSTSSLLDLDWPPVPPFPKLGDGSDLSPLSADLVCEVEGLKGQQLAQQAHVQSTSSTSIPCTQVSPDQEIAAVVQLLLKEQGLPEQDVNQLCAAVQASMLSASIGPSEVAALLPLLRGLRP